MSIQTDVQELQAIRHELKTLTDRRTKLKAKETQVMTRIATFLEAKGQHGVKYQGTAVILESKKVFSRKSKKEREADSISLLQQQYNVKEPAKLLQDLQYTQRGGQTTVQKIKMKTYKEA